MFPGKKCLKWGIPVGISPDAVRYPDSLIVDFTQVITTNEQLNQTVHEYQAPVITYSTMDSDGYGKSFCFPFCLESDTWSELNFREIRPPNMDLSGATKYPVLFEVYGGPGSQKVDTQFKRDWHHYLACSLNYIIVVVDGRGTGFKGRKLRSVVKGNLGFWETKDQIAGARHVLSCVERRGVLMKLTGYGRAGVMWTRIGLACGVG